MAQQSGDFTMPTDDLPEPPPETREPVRFGPARTQITAICCPACGSLSVIRRHSKTGMPFAYFACQDDGCGHWWREPFMVGRSGRALIP